MRDRSGWRRVIWCAISLFIVTAPVRAETPVGTGERSFYSRIDLSVEAADLDDKGHAQVFVVFPKFRGLSFLQLQEVEIAFEGLISEYPIAARAERSGTGPHRAILGVTSKLTISGPGIDRLLAVPDSFGCPVDRSLDTSNRCLIADKAGPALLRASLIPANVEGYSGTGRIAVEVTLAAEVSDDSRHAALARAVAGPIRLSGDLHIVYRYEMQGTREELLEKLASPGVRERLSPAEARRLRASLRSGG